MAEPESTRTTSPSARLAELAAAGVSIWLDDLSRGRLDSGSLAELVRDCSVTGVTTNPAIFAAALAGGTGYAAAIRRQADAGATVEEAVFALTTDDVRDACDLLWPVYDRSGHVDGRVSIEVAPTLAFDTEGTLTSARQLWAAVDRDNVLIKIPATDQGAAAITAALAEGISVNVTLIFGLDRYTQVMEAYLAGLEQALNAGRDLAEITSVASFFVSRVDTEIDRRLDLLPGDHAGLKGKAGVANARLAYRAFESTFRGARWERLAAAGAKPQRPLWASTGVKSPDYPDTMYVADLVQAGTVNTMPEKTMMAFADHGVVVPDSCSAHYAESEQVMADLAAAGIEYADVIDTLETEGVAKFVAAWGELLASVNKAMGSVTTYPPD